MKKTVTLRSVLLAVGLGAVATGCGYLTTHHVVTGPPGPPYAGDVRIVLDGAPEPPDLQEVAIVQAVGQGTKADLEDLIAGLKDEAHALGCDIVVHVRVDQGAATASASGVAARSIALAGRPAPPPPPPPDTPPGTAATPSP